MDVTFEPRADDTLKSLKVYIFPFVCKANNCTKHKTNNLKKVMLKTFFLKIPQINVKFIFKNQFTCQVR